MAEICERVKSNMIFDEDNKVTILNLETSLESYMYQVGLARTKEKTQNVPEQFVNRMKEALGLVAVTEEVSETLAKTKEIRARV
jgi:hypothetical protein